MTTSRRRLTTAHVGCAVALFAAIAGVAGCAAPQTPADSPRTTTETALATPTPTPASLTADPTVTDAESCEAFSDVLTILHNTMVGLNEERMTEREYDGWMMLATRALDRIPTTGEGAVSDGIAALKAAAPAIAFETIPVGTSGTPIGTPEWYNAAPLADACNAAGYQFSAQGFTGG